MAEARMFYNEDCNVDLLKGKHIAVIGYVSTRDPRARPRQRRRDSRCFPRPRQPGGPTSL